ncbi:hypothetical protein NQ317_017756 [Molorchus minor]|uniref:CHK kinase-like domain-containing protein n=1 Tax=Molorchus minor TaxID=1323400 RepID=A0ABQ9JI27_9CUCU|nr:hypothetical protein NQ317_017756 [Molorchus minor]
MSRVGVAKADITSWVTKAVETVDLKNCEINVQGKTEKGDGYVGEIVFVSVNGENNENEKQYLDLVVKHGKSNDDLRNNIPVRDTFEGEIHVYEKVIPTFQKFQREKQVLNMFENVPKCYLTLMLKNMEVLVLENLRKVGYELHDKTQPMNADHLKLILRKYGQFHALSFALKDQRKDEFKSLCDGVKDLFIEFLKNTSVKESYRKSLETFLIMAKERGDLDLYQKLKDLIIRDVDDILVNSRSQKEEQCVLLHGDCWNNNFMFKYKQNDRTSPYDVKILDWQLSTLLSPAFDLAYLIYANSSQTELDRFDELLETYYSSFSNFLRDLGSDPEKLFSYKDLKRHWAKHSTFAALSMPTILKFVLCEKEDAPAFEDFRDGDDLGSLMEIHLTDPDAYYNRIKAVLNHYFNYKF